MLHLLLACVTAKPTDTTAEPREEAAPDTDVDTGATDTATGGTDTDTDDTATGDTDTGDTDTDPTSLADIPGVGWWEGETEWANLLLAAPAEDLDGDGADEVFLWMRNVASAGREPPGVVVYVPGQVPDAGTPWSNATGEQTWIGDFFAAPLSGVLPAGDVDGDGVGDVWLVNAGASTMAGYQRWLLLGPADRWAAALADPSVGADAHVELGFGSTVGGSDGAVGDVDGDGLSDAVWSTIAQDDMSSPTEFYLWLTPGESAPSSRGIGDDPWLTLDTLDGPRMVGDLDGDGLQEIGLSGGRTIHVLDGAALVGGAGDDASPYVTTLPPTGDDTIAFFLEDGALLGDRDGDGLPELTWMERTSGSYTCLRAGTLSEPLPANLDALATIGGCWDDADGTEIYTIADVDGDGVRDTSQERVVDGRAAGCVLPSGSWPSAGTFEPGPNMVCVADAAYIHAADLDGDGAQELIGSEATWDGALTEQGRVLVVPGVDIPWSGPGGWWPEP